jgi:TIR domain
MTASYEHQVFISYPREQRAGVESVVADLRAAGLTTWWDKDIPPGDAWRDRLNEKIRHSRHFLLYCNVQAKASEMVNHEIKTFREDAKGDSSRKLFVLRAPDCEPKHVPPDLGEVQHANSLSDVLVFVLKEARDELDQRFRESERRAQKEKKELEENLTNERGRVAEARKYYRHRRFWGPFAEHRDEGGGVDAGTEEVETLIVAVDEPQKNTKSLIASQPMTKMYA